MNPTGQSSQQQSGGWQPKSTQSLSRSANRSAKRQRGVAQPNPLQNQAQLHKIMSLFQ